MSRLWPFQRWVRHDFGYGPVLVIAHSRWLGRLGKCKCMDCLSERVGEAA